MASPIGTLLTQVDVDKLFPESAINPQPIVPPAPVVEEEPEIRTKLDAVRETALKFDPGKSDHNNPGNTNWSPRIQKELGNKVTKGDAYIDNAGVERFVARFDSPDTGKQVNDEVTARIWEESGYDPIKFAEIYTGTRPEHGDEKYQTVLNYANEIERISKGNETELSASDIETLFGPSQDATSIPPPPVQVGSELTPEMAKLLINANAPVHNPEPAPDPEKIGNDWLEAITGVGTGSVQGLSGSAEQYLRVARLVSGKSYGNSKLDGPIALMQDFSEGIGLIDPDRVDRAIQGGTASIIQSLLAGIPGMLAGLVGGSPSGPGALVSDAAGFALSTGVIFSLAEYERFMEEVTKHAMEVYGITDPEELSAMRTAVIPEGAVSAIAEGGFEAISNLTAAKVLGFFGAKTIVKPAKLATKEIITNFFKKTGIIGTVESTSEVATTVVQVKSREHAGMDQGPLGEAMIETLGPALFQSFIMGFGGSVYRGKYADTSNNRKVFKDQVMGIIADKQINISEAEVDGMLTLIDERAGKMGISPNDFIGQFIASVDKADPTLGADQLFQQAMPESMANKSTQIITDKMPNLSKPRDVINMLRNNGITKGEMDWYDLESFLLSVEDESGLNMVTKQEVLEYIGMMGQHAGLSEFSALGEDQVLRDQWTNKNYYASDEDYITTGLPIHYDREPEYYSDVFMLNGPEEYYGEKVLYFDREKLKHLAHLNPMFGFDGELLGLNGSHFPGFQEQGMPDTQLGHYRYAGRQATNGGDAFVVEELQSDTHQRGQSSGYTTWEDLGYYHTQMSNYESWMFNVFMAKYGALVNPMQKAEMSHAGQTMNIVTEMAKKGDVSVEDYQQFTDLHSDMIEARDFYRQNKAAPIPFQKTWMNLLTKRMLLDAIEHKATYFAWTSGDIQTRRWGDLEVQWGLNEEVTSPTETKDPKVRKYFPHKGDIVIQYKSSLTEEVNIMAWDGQDLEEGIRQFEDSAPADVAKFARKIMTAVQKSPEIGRLKPHESIMDLVYNKKMAQIVKKLTGVEPKPIDMIGLAEKDHGEQNEDRRVKSLMGIPLTDKVMEKILKSTKNLFQDEKASVEFMNDGRAVLRMAQGADVSSLIHEIGHVFRRTLTKRELETIQDSYGVKDGVWTVNAEEKWARAFERWARTGTTSNEALQPIFADFRKWMTRIYKRIKGTPLEGKLSHDMRNFFDRMLSKPDLESILDGKEIIEQLGGQYILNAETKDISMLAAMLGSPETVAADFPEAQDLISRIIEAEFRAEGSAQEDYEMFKEAERLALSDLGSMAGNRIVRLLTPSRVDRQMKKVRKAVEILTTGTESEIIKLQQEQPGVFEAAKILRKYFDTMRKKLQDYKRGMFLRALKGNERAAFEDIMMAVTESGKELTDATLKRILKKHNVDKDVFTEIANDYTDIENWGLEDYITNIERGMYKIVEGEGKNRRVVAIGITKKHAILKAKEYLKNNPDTTALTIDTDAGNFDPHAQLTRTQYWMILGKVKSAYDKDFKEIQDALRGALGKGIVIKPTMAFAGPTRKRGEQGLEGEENIFDAMYTYAHVVQKKIALDPVLNDARGILPTLPKQLRDMISSMADYAKGKYSFGDQLIDNMFKGFGLRPMMWTRMVSQIRSKMAWAKLGYRPVASFINFVSGQGHTWVKFGAGYMGRAKIWIKTEEGKDFLRRQEKYLGTAFSIDTSGKSRGGSKLWQPLGMFSAAEVPNRQINAAAAYLYGIDQGMSIGAAEADARRAVRMIQFTYNAASLPLILRSPTGKLMGQFKPYLVKEIEFIRGLRGSGQILKYLGLQMALAGPRGLLWVTRSLPILGMIGLWDEIEEWMNKPHPEIPYAGDQIPTLSRGVVGMLGGDISMPATVQLPNKPEDWAGPFLSDLWRLWDQVMRPMMEGEKHIDMNLRNWALRIAPVAFYWDQMIQSVYDKEGWVKDRRSGNKLFKVDGNWDRALLAMGVAPDQRSDALMAQRILQKEEELRNRNAVKTTNELIKLIKEQKEIPKEIFDDLINLGVSRRTIREAIVRKELPPHLRTLLQTRTIKRPRVFDLYKQ